MWNWIISAIALCMIVIGMITFVMPIPIGALLMATGLGLLVSANPYFRGLVRRFRKNNSKVDQHFRNSEAKAPGFLRRVLEQTDPQRETN
ncbi:hypothetical protein [Calycomorphotria hydatis]|uniref:Transmembrane protein (PGPGW) n=1 Tax=Calycomorphotria hydatis TaxID=2528027 RepID=A0A517TFG1_9PLAN|nr:hypothetical protein [Calycomorphotria hydatis]QDT67097.1 hypothetical protein V22_43700 [Calycomorphotria hydatis]